ncbi:MAG: DUF2242 domain-containing protein [Candidatus Omnitrophica bacterium]|nr:DUF2242 domain-containing protein [Candidatus Omnitrophota bacterium]
MQKLIIFLLLMSFSFVGCGTTKMYSEVFKEDTSYNSREYQVASPDLFNIILKTFYSKGFIVDSEDKENGMIVAKKIFQKGKRNIVVALQAKIILDGEIGSSVFLNAVQTTEKLYVADRTRFFMFLIPLPGGGGKQATKVQEGEIIINDKDFYSEFFALIEAKIAA